MKKIRITYCTTLAVLLLIAGVPMSGCKKLVDVTAPATNLTQKNVYTTDLTTAAVLTGIYAQMSGNLNLNLPAMSNFPGLSADEYTLYPGATDPAQIAYYTNKLANNTISPGNDFWSFTYRMIFMANAAIEGVNASTTLSTTVKQQALGEAKFVRALCYFYLVNLYGDVPLVLSTDYSTNASISRTPKAAVWIQINADLLDAQNGLSTNFLDGSLQLPITERVRPTKWAATALLARAYLYQGSWADAETQASLVINNTSQFGLSALNNAFLKASLGNKEAIWQLQPTQSGFNTQEAQFFTIPSSGPGFFNPVYLSNSLLNSFEAGDQRKANWINNVSVGAITYSYSYKYKVSAANPSITSTAGMTEFEMVLRLGEQYLIRAEAEAQENKLTQSAADLNIIRSRAGLPNTTATTQSALLTAIYHERQVELFSEWGHRWLDLKRTNTIDAVMGAPGNVSITKGSTWQSYQQWYPIPLNELQKDPHLVQNSGY